MKKNTTQTPIPAPQTKTKMSLQEKAVAVLGAVAFAAMLYAGPGKALYKKFGPAPTVECHKCHHIVAKASASERKNFARMYGHDDKFTSYYFCQQHVPAWAYMIGEEFFRPQADMQCNEDGSQISNIYTCISGFWFEQDTNGETVVKKQGTITTVTNIGGHHMAKHLDY